MTASARNRRRCFRLCNNPRPSSLVRPLVAMYSAHRFRLSAESHRSVIAPLPQKQAFGGAHVLFLPPRRGTPLPPVKGGKNGGKGAQACGPVKARFQRSRSRKTGSRGVPGRTPCSPYGAARYSALYRPDNRTRKCPALLAGAGHFSWAGKPPPRQPADFSTTSLAAGSAWQGGM